MALDIAKELGAEKEFSTQRLTIYLPNKDRAGAELTDIEKWVKEGRELLGKIGGGATALPPADGNWINETGETIWESTKIVFCSVIPDEFEARIRDLREFLHRFGRTTNQGEVVVEFDGTFYRIKQFDNAPGG